MKRILKTSIVAVALLTLFSYNNKASAQFSARISFQTFYDDLSPYGRWIDYPQYGYVWFPSVDAGFRPYSTMGHWEWSDEYEWIWVSDYDWGWAPFHYGRWFFDPAYGWLWMPGYDWSPAWVAWRSGGDYYGWAPLNPGFSIGISIGTYSPPIDYWCFAPRRYITSPRIYDYCYNSRRNVTIINNTTIINNYNYYGGRSRNVFVNGPRRNEVERYTNERIRSVSFRDSDRPGRTEFRNNSISMYRPRVERNNNNQAAPRSFGRYNISPQQNDGLRRQDNTFTRGNNLPERNANNDNNQMRQNNDNNSWRRGNDRNINEQRTNNLPQRNEERTNNLPQRNEQSQTNPFERRRQIQNDNQNSQQRNFENRDNNRSNSNNENRNFRSFERRQQPVQENNRNSGNRNWGNQNNNQPRQMEQPRQFERRDQGNGDRGNGNFGRGRRNQ